VGETKCPSARLKKSTEGRKNGRSEGGSLGPSIGRGSTQLGGDRGEGYRDVKKGLRVGGEMNRTEGGIPKPRGPGKGNEGVVGVKGGWD